jgi:hypothetical protein
MYLFFHVAAINQDSNIPGNKNTCAIVKIRRPETATYDSWLFNNDSLKTGISKQLPGPGVYPVFIKELPGHAGPFYCKALQFLGGCGLARVAQRRDLPSTAMELVCQH